MNNITIPGVCKSRTIAANTIIRIEASGNYSLIFFEDGSRLLTAKVLRWFQQLLPAEMFARVHRGTS
ncbi:MAG: LytTR family transcriptional regulator [Chitinophagaceae bacterium]|nr:LytTR family transcriptional regulator [Chitinophagaceae bacterium]